MGGATRGRTAEPTSRDQNRRQGREQGKGNERRSHKQEKILGACANGGGEAEQSGAFSESAK